MLLSVVTDDGDLFQIECEAGQRIYQVKEAIFQRTHIDARSQILVHEGKILQNEDFLQTNSVLFLISSYQISETRRTSESKTADPQGIEEELDLWESFGLPPPLFRLVDDSETHPSKNAGSQDAKTDRKQDDLWLPDLSH